MLIRFFLDRKSKKPKTVELERELEIDTLYLLVQFNHVYNRIRRISDLYLMVLAEKFPHVLWSGKVLRLCLDVLQLLSRSVDMDASGRAPEFDVPNTEYKLTLMDNLASREVRCCYQ